MDKKNICLWIIFLVLIVLAAAIPVNAGDLMGQHCADAYLFEPGSEIRCETETQYIMWADLFSDSNEFIMEGVKDSTTGYANIDAKNSPEIKNINNNILLIANALAVLILTYAGYLWIISSTDPKGRNKAKRQLINAIYMLIFINAGYFIASLGYDLGTETASYLEVNTEEFFVETPWTELNNANATSLDVEGTYNRFSSLAVASPVLLISGWAYTSLMYLRNMTILLLFALSPLIVVLFFFDPTKPYGSILAILFGIELFLPVLFFPLFKISTLMFSQDDPRINILVMAAALMIAVLLHLTIVAVAIIKSAGSFRNKEDFD